MIREVAPYTVLAAGFDAVMVHVDYPGWVEYIELLLDHHGVSPASVIELGCGTGSFALLFGERNPVRYLATDGSAEMIEVAKQKGVEMGSDVDFSHLNFSRLPVGERFDAAILLYDALNYLVDSTAVEQFISAVAGILVPGALFVFDHTTPANSLNNQLFFEESGSCDAFSYVRRSSYDAELRLHKTLFELATPSGTFQEQHVQRAYQISEIRDILRRSPFGLEAAYADFSLKQANDSAERIHWVARVAQKTASLTSPKYPHTLF